MIRNQAPEGRKKPHQSSKLRVRLIRARIAPRLFVGMEKNQLYYGDNLAVLREHIKDESVDLIYLDPPFNSRQDYNVLFAERDGTRSASQIMAFEDTWEWNMDAERAYEEIFRRFAAVFSLGVVCCRVSQQCGSELLPNVSLVVGYIVFLEKCDELLLKRMLFVVLFLLRDISRYRCRVRFAYAEDSVAGLPGKYRVPLFVYPPR